MHPSLAGLVAFCDGEAGAIRSRRIARHLAKCDRCGDRLRRIGNQKDELLAASRMPPGDCRQGLAGLLAAIADWRRSPDGERASDLRSRLRRQIETYFGSPAVTAMERPGMPAEELLGKASEVFEVFLGPAAAEAVKDDVLSRLDGGRWEASR
jgi:anti-sigma factor RsiW